MIQATVSESNGEISCSVEETNRVRSLLGLKPLNLENKSEEAIAVENFKAKQLSDQKNREAEALREQLEKAKNKRLLNAKLEGPTLGDADSGLSSAADWVKRSRIKALETEKAKLAAKKMEDDEKEMLDNHRASYHSGDLKGLRVKHASNDFEIGEQVILTLADSNILSVDDSGKVLGLAEEEDVLENINMSEADRRIQREKQKKRLKQPIYAGYDDDEFDESGQVAARPSILSHYDKEKKVGPKLVLGVDGIAASTETTTVTAESAAKAASVQSLKTELKDIQEYYTHSEFALKNAKIKGLKDKKKRKIRKKTDEMDENEEGDDSKKIDSDNKSEMLVDLGPVSGNGTDHGSRQLRTSNEVDAAALQRKLGYEKAVQAASEKSIGHNSFGTSTSGNNNSSGNSNGTNKHRRGMELQQIDDDADVAMSLANARRIATMARQKYETVQESLDDPAAKTMELMSKASKHVSNLLPQKNYEMELVDSDGFKIPRSQENELKFDELDAEGRRADGTLVFTSTTEFTTRLQARLNEKARSIAEAAVKAAAVKEAPRTALHQPVSSSVVNSNSSGWSAVNAIEEDPQFSKPPPMKRRRRDDSDDENVDRTEDDRFGSGVKIGKAGDNDNEDTMMLEGSDDDDEDDEAYYREGSHDTIGATSTENLDNGLTNLQPLVNKGMAATLALLKSSGELHKGDELAGRTKDSRMQDPSAKDNGVKLEYRDEYGRKLTQKEAFRQLCYKFHGYGPSQKNKEKRLKAMEQHSKAGSSKAVEVGTMKSLVRAQEATGKAHVTVQGGLNGINSTSAAELAAMRAKNKAKAQAKAGKDNH